MNRAFAVVGLLAGCGSAVATQLCNPIPIIVPAAGTTSGPANPYPGLILAQNFAPSLSSISVQLHGFTHNFPDDVDILLVAPSGGTVLLMSDCGGSFGVGGVELTFTDGAPALPDAAQIVSGTYSPTNYGAGDTFDAPAPAGPYGSTLSSLLGSNPNGQWRLFVMDDATGGAGEFGGGWCIVIEAVPAPGTAALCALAMLGLARRRR